MSNQDIMSRLSTAVCEARNVWTEEDGDIDDFVARACAGVFANRLGEIMNMPMRDSDKAVAALNALWEDLRK